MKATNVLAKSSDFRRLSDFGFSEIAQHIIMSMTGDPALLILWGRRADYYNSPYLLSETLACSRQNAASILMKMDSLHLFFHESHEARFFRNVFAVINHDLPGICVPNLYERQIENPNLDDALSRMRQILDNDEFESVKNFYGYDTGRPIYFEKKCQGKSVSNYASQSAMRKLSRDGELLMFYRSSFKEPD